MASPIKQRLVGACILLALAVIFVPALFDRETIEPIDTQTQIPIAPVIETIDIPQPEAVQLASDEAERIRQATPERSRFLFSPRVDLPLDPSPNNNNLKDKSARLDKTPAGKQAANLTFEAPKDASTRPRLAEKADLLEDANTASSVNQEKILVLEKTAPVEQSGFWVLQLASFSELSSAKSFRDKVKNKGHKAYIETVDTPAGKRSRVFIGPFTSRSLIDDEKAKVDKRFGVQSLVVTFKP